ncbi:probable aminotransferase TAT2 [Tanacetum coccineum]
MTSSDFRSGVKRCRFDDDFYRIDYELVTGLNAKTKPNANILVPKPEFPIYELCAAFRNVEIRHYNLLSEKGWEVDLNAIDELVDENTVAIMIINPRKPCGNVYSYQHLKKIIGYTAEIAKRHKILVVANEIYGHLAFGENPFMPMGVFGSMVPVITLAKAKMYDTTGLLHTKVQTCFGVCRLWLVPKLEHVSVELRYPLHHIQVQGPPTLTLIIYTLVFQQHQDESIYDAWTHFKNVIQRVPHHGLNLWSLTQFFYDHVDDYTRMDLHFVADGNLRELSEVANFKAQAKRLFGNENVWVEMHRGIAWDKVENLNPQSTPKVLPLFKECTPPVTYPEEIEETLGTPIEVEPLDETQLEDLGLNTCNHDIPLSSREVPSFDEPEPQP